MKITSTHIGSGKYRFTDDNGNVLASGAKATFFAACREAIANGHSPDEGVICISATGIRSFSLPNTLGLLAQWSVSEPDKGRAKIIKYVPNTQFAGSDE